MKKKIWLFVIVVVAATCLTWFVLANKFEDVVRTTYLPILQEQKEQGSIDLDLNNIKIHKYKFSVVVENFTVFPKSDIFQTKLDAISLCYNPFTKNILISSSGKRVSSGSGESEVYIPNPSFSCTINEPLLKGNMDNIHITLSNQAQDLLRATDNAILLSNKGSLYEVIGNLDVETNQYSLKVIASTKENSLTRDYFKWPGQLADKLFNVSQEDQKIRSFIDDLTADYYYIIAPSNSIDSNVSVTITADKKHFENIFKLVQTKIQRAELAVNLIENFDINKELFNIAIDTSYGNNLLNNKLLFGLSGDGKEIKGDFNLEDSKNYPKDKLPEITKLTSELLAKIYNKINAESESKTQELTPDDFTNLANSLIDVKSINFSTNISYKTQESDGYANLHVCINEHIMGLAIQGHDKELYTGIFALTDPFKLINTKTKFARDVVLPLIEKISNNDKTNLVNIQKYISNIENNGFDALKVFSKNAELAAGDKLETDFSFEPKSFNFKINGKSFLAIITDEKIVKFLRGFSTEPNAQEPLKDKAIEIEEKSENVESKASNSTDKIPENMLNGNNDNQDNSK